MFISQIQTLLQVFKLQSQFQNNLSKMNTSGLQGIIYRHSTAKTRYLQPQYIYYSYYTVVTAVVSSIGCPNSVNSNSSVLAPLESLDLPCLFQINPAMRKMPITRINTPTPTTIHDSSSPSPKILNLWFWSLWDATPGLAVTTASKILNYNLHII